MSGQLESRHFFRARDTVQHRNGDFGTVVEGQSLYAVIDWTDGRREEVDQFDPLVIVVARSEGQ